MQFDDTTRETQRILMGAAVERGQFEHEWIQPVHVLVPYTLYTTSVTGVLRRQGIEPSKLRLVVGGLYPRDGGPQVIERYHPSVLAIVNGAHEWVKQDGVRRLVRPDHLFIRLIESDDEVLQRALQLLDVDVMLLRDDALRVRAELDRQSAARVGDS